MLDLSSNLADKLEMRKVGRADQVEIRRRSGEVLELLLVKVKKSSRAHTPKGVEMPLGSTNGSLLFAYGHTA